jgi:hypothetical protein
MSGDGFGMCLKKAVMSHEIQILPIDDKEVKSFTDKDLLSPWRGLWLIATRPVVAQI